MTLLRYSMRLLYCGYMAATVNLATINLRARSGVLPTFGDLPTYVRTYACLPVLWQQSMPVLWN